MDLNQWPRPNVFLKKHPVQLQSRRPHKYIITNLHLTDFWVWISPTVGQRHVPPPGRTKFHSTWVLCSSILQKPHFRHSHVGHGEFRDTPLHLKSELFLLGHKVPGSHFWKHTVKQKWQNCRESFLTDVGKNSRCKLIKSPCIQSSRQRRTEAREPLCTVRTQISNHVVAMTQDTW